MDWTDGVQIGLVCVLIGVICNDLHHTRRVMRTIQKLRHRFETELVTAQSEITQLRQNLARAGRALMAHPQGHDQKLIDDALGWVGEDNMWKAKTEHQRHH